MATFLHDWIAPFDPEEDEWRVNKKLRRFPKYSSVQKAEESARPSPSEIKQMYSPWDFLDEETWQKIYRGEIPAEDYMSTVHVFPPSGKFEGTTVRAFGPNALPNDYAEKHPPYPDDFHTMAEPAPMSSEKFILVSDDVSASGEEHSKDGDSAAETESNEAGGESGGDAAPSDSDNSSDSHDFDELAIPDDYISNYEWKNDGEFNNF